MPYLGGAAANDRSFNEANIAPLSIEDFEWGWRIANAAASGAMPMTSPAARGSVLVEGDDGQLEELMFRDTIRTRMMFAVKDHFGADSPKWIAFMLRYWAMHELQSDPRMDR